MNEYMRINSGYQETD